VPIKCVAKILDGLRRQPFIFAGTKIEGETLALSVRLVKCIGLTLFDDCKEYIEMEL